MADINSINKELQEGEAVSESIEIKYRPAKMFHRIMANLLDLLIFALFCVAFFLAARAITINTDAYQISFNKYRLAQTESSLYYDDKSQSYPTLVEYLDGDSGATQTGKHKKAKLAVESFYTFIVQDKEMDEERRSVVDKAYTDYFTKENLYNNSLPYIESFAINENQVSIVECDYSDAPISQEIPYDINYYSDVYKPFIRDYLLPIFGNYCTEYSENLSKVSMMFVLIDAPIAYVISGLLVWLVPPLIFRRGHMTFGKALYHIGLVDSRYLNLTWKRFLARFAIFFFAELLLSIFTFAIPMFISTSMMLFSKKKQGFPDYMLGCREVDTSSNKIYYSLEEINLTRVNPHHKPVDFKPRKDY